MLVFDRGIMIDYGPFAAVWLFDNCGHLVRTIGLGLVKKNQSVQEIPPE